jgi:site-specific DNA-methyltransferase (adenine-specific)
MNIKLDNATVYHGSNLDILPTLPDNSVDSIVTDPPYELGFMGKSWDSSGIAYSVELWTECMRVLKPGGHLLAFGGSRTWHRLAVAIEDAGFEMRDSIAWLYGSGFPKSLDVSKAIDKAAGAEREIVGFNDAVNIYDDAHAHRQPDVEQSYSKSPITAPATAEAEKWQGWGTALKPAFEPVVVARKPLGGKTVAANVLAYGTGGLNIDASRIGRQEGDNSSAGNRTATFGTQETKSGGDGSGGWEQNSGGRWPANIILDPYTAKLLDEQSGVSKSPKTYKAEGYKDSSMFGIGGVNHDKEFGDTGGASRFFYVAKASKRDRNEGLEELPAVRASAMGYDIGLGEAGEGMFKDRNPQKQNFHPTVKPTTLMEYLIKLVTPEGGTVLDPFTGSGSTGKAALLNGYQFIGIELTEEYLPIIEGRLKWANEQAQEEEKKATLF